MMLMQTKNSPFATAMSCFLYQLINLRLCDSTHPDLSLSIFAMSAACYTIIVICFAEIICRYYAQVAIGHTCKKEKYTDE
jgi:hypothetical protein